MIDTQDAIYCPTALFPTAVTIDKADDDAETYENNLMFARLSRAHSNTLIFGRKC